MRLFRQLARPRLGSQNWLMIVAPIASVALSEAVLYVALQFAMKAARAGVPTVLFFVVPLAIALLVAGLSLRHARPIDRSSGPVLIVPIVLHLFFLAMLLTSLPDRPAALLPISIAMFAIGLGAHWAIGRPPKSKQRESRTLEA